MLVHHRGHFAGAHIIALGRHHARLVTQQRHRQTGIVGHVALAQGNHRKPRLRQRLHMRPHFQRRTQAFVQVAATVEHAALRFLVDAMVMGHVTAGTQHAEETPGGVLCFEGLGNQVIPGRTRRGDDRLGNGERAAVLQLHRQTHQRRGEIADTGHGVIAMDHAFVAFDPGQGQCRLRGDGLGQVEHLLFAAATATPADHAVFDHHVQAHATGGEVGTEVGDVVRVIDHAIEVERRVSQQVGDQCHVRRADQLVGHQDTAHAMGVGSAGLRSAGQGDAPGTGIQLATEQRRGHAGLAMGRQFRSAVADERLHPADVVFQRLAMQYQRRQADITHQAGTDGRRTFIHVGSLGGRRHGRTPRSRGCR
ncbi:hypothetical protein D3C86_1301690 [compost metagenome]